MILSNQTAVILKLLYCRPPFLNQKLKLDQEYYLIQMVRALKIAILHDVSINKLFI